MYHIACCIMLQYMEMCSATHRKLIALNNKGKKVICPCAHKNCICVSDLPCVVNIYLSGTVLSTANQTFCIFHSFFQESVKKKGKEKEKKKSNLELFKEELKR